MITSLILIVDCLIASFALLSLCLASEHKDDKGHPNETDPLPSFQKKYILHVLFSGLKMK